MKRVAIGAMAIVHVALGCGSSGGGGTGGTTSSACVPGASVACVCATAQMGAQICSTDGSGYGACVCSSGSNVAGTTGSAGAPGTGGAIGTGGIIGSGGAGGKAGASGGEVTGGVTGSGGHGGALGSGSSTGMGGSNNGYNGRWVTVTLTDAIIGPGKQDGTSWDETFTIPKQVLNDIGTALAGGDPVGGALAVLAGPTLNDAISTTAKPDPYGWVQATAFGMTGMSYYLADRDHYMADTYTPVWPVPFQYSDVPIDSDVRIRVFIVDEDLVDDDSLPPAEINSNDLKAALSAQKKFYVRVNDQTAGDVLFLGISVVQQAPP